MSTTCENNNSPLVTVAMVTYNSSGYVKMAIESVLASSYQNFELIISDDCSKDDTWNIIEEYNDPRIKPYVNDQNVGEYLNRNRCIDLAKGKYFIFIDGDDLIYPHGLEFFVKMMEGFPVCGMAITKGYLNNVLYPCMFTPKQLMEIEYLGNSILSVSFVSTFFKTEVLREIGGVSDLYISGDEFIRLLIASRHNTLIVNYGLTWHRETPGQASRDRLAEFVGTAEMFNIKQRLYREYNIPISGPQFSEYYKMASGGLVRILLRQIIKFRFKHALKLKKIAGIRLADFKYLLSKKEDISFLNEYSPVNPFAEHFMKSPYSRRVS